MRTTINALLATGLLVYACGLRTNEIIVTHRLDATQTHIRNPNSSNGEWYAYNKQYERLMEFSRSAEMLVPFSVFLRAPDYPTRKDIQYENQRDQAIQRAGGRRIYEL